MDKLNPKNWSLAIRRVTGIFVLAINLAFLGSVFTLASNHKGWPSPNLPIIKIYSVVTILIDSLFIWLVIGLRKGYKKGLLYALAFSALLLLILLAARTGIDICVWCLFV